LINNERRNVNLLVEDWNKLTKISSISNLGLEEAEKIRREAEVIKNFLVNILSIVDGLTPNNSGLSQSEIDTYLAQLPTIDSINQVLAVLDASIASDAQSLEPPAPTVTPDEVIAQQNLVEQTEAEVSALEEEVAQQPTEISPPTPESYQTPGPRIINTKQGIIIQPGPPQLIPSTDPF